MHARLEAIMEDDMGKTSLDAGRISVAIGHYQRALTLTKAVGGSFREDWLNFTNDAVRRFPELANYQ